MAPKDRSGSRNAAEHEPRPAPPLTIDPEDDDDGREAEPAPGPDPELGDLADLEGAGGDGKTITIYRIDESGRKAPPGFAGVPAYALKLTGVFDLDDVKARIGGGHYIAYVKDSSGRLEGKKRRFAIDGDPIVLRRETTPASPDVSPAIAQLREELVELKRTLATRPPAPDTQLAFVRETMQLVRELAPTPAPASTSTIASVREVVELARELAVEGGDSVATVLRESLPRVFDYIEKRSGVTTSAPARLPTSTTTPAPASRTQVEILVEMLASMVARGIARATDPNALADAAEEILLDTELEQVRGATTDQVLLALKAAEKRYPILADPRSVEYAKLFVEALKNPPEETEPTA